MDCGLRQRRVFRTSLFSRWLTFSVVRRMGSHHCSTDGDVSSTNPEIKIENDSHLAKPSYDSSSGFSGVSLRRKRGKNGVIPSLSRSCKALACSSKGQSERPPVFKPTRIDMLLFDVQAFLHESVLSAPLFIRKDHRLSFKDR